MMILTGSLLTRYLKPDSVIKPQRILMTVAAQDVPLNGALVYREQRLAVMRDSASVYAVSLICTHLGCIVNAGEDGFFCPCHGSAFDTHGNVLKGPAAAALKRYPVQNEGGVIRVMA